MPRLSIATLVSPEIPADVATHCAKGDSLGLLELAIQIAAKHFSSAGPITVELETDVDSDEERPILNVPVAASVDECQAQYFAYLEEWNELAPLESRLKIGLISYPLGPNE